MSKTKKEQKSLSGENIEVFELPVAGSISVVFNRLLAGGEDVVTVEMASVLGATRTKIANFYVPHAQVEEFAQKLIDFAQTSTLQKPTLLPDTGAMDLKE